jgi:phasin family protein
MQMSKPVTNPFFEIDFSKFMDVSKFMDMSKLMGEMKMIPCMNFEALMTAQRRNIEAFTAVNQAAFESMQALLRRQADLARQSFEETTSMMNTVMSCPPEEKVMRQAEASKVAVEKCMANAREIAETLAKCNYQAMETVSNRMNEGLEELRSMMKPTTQAAA